MAQVTQATKQSISCIFSQHMRANKHTLKSQTTLYEVRYLKWESEFEVAQATKHTHSIDSNLKLRRKFEVYI
jgi:hypothetical protein